MGLEVPSERIGPDYRAEMPPARRLHDHIPPTLAKKLGRPPVLDKTMIDGVKTVPVSNALRTNLTKGINKGVAASLGSQAAACGLRAAWASFGFK